MIIPLTKEQKARYVQEYVYDELSCIELMDEKERIKQLGTDDIKEIVQGIIAYPLEHENIFDMYNHMDSKYFHICSDEQIKQWEDMRES